MNFHAYVFADGSASAANDVGAWATVVNTGERQKILYGVEYPTTISRCELLPIMAGFRWLRTDGGITNGMRICVYSDSEYTVKTLSGMYDRRKHKELWGALDHLVHGLQVTYQWRERNSLPQMALCDMWCSGMRHKMMDMLRTLVKDPRNPDVDIPVMPIPQEKQQ